MSPTKYYIEYIIEEDAIKLPKDFNIGKNTTYFFVREDVINDYYLKNNFKNIDDMIKYFKNNPSELRKILTDSAIKWNAIKHKQDDSDYYEYDEDGEVIKVNENLYKKYKTLSESYKKSNKKIDKGSRRSKITKR